MAILQQAFGFFSLAKLQKTWSFLQNDCLEAL